MEDKSFGCFTLSIIFIISTIIFIGYQYYRDNNADYQTKDNRGYNVEVIDSCEYLVRHSGYSGYMAHKGNCKFCEERRKKNENR